MIANNYDQVGRTLGPEVARQVPPVGMAMEHLEKEIHGLREIVATLERRLSVVMRPVPVSDQKAPMGVCGGSPLTHQIEAMTQLVRSTGSDVMQLIDCLEI